MEEKTLTEPLFDLVQVNGKIYFDNVYLNGLHALRSLELRNISEHELIIKLRSNLGEQIAFQLTNENLPERFFAYSTRKSDGELKDSTRPGLDMASLEKRLASNSQSPWATPTNSPPGSPIPADMVTNTVFSAAVGFYGSDGAASHGHQFNQLFNYVNHIDELALKPGQTQKIVVAFLPDGRERGRRFFGNSKNELEEFKLDASGDDDELFDFFEINGLLFFFAYKQYKRVDEDPNDHKADDSECAATENVSDVSPEGTSTDLVKDVLKVSSRDSLAARDIQPSSPPDYQVKDPFIITLTYESFLSEIELYWHITVIDLSHFENATCIKLLDYENGEALTMQPLPAFSIRRIRLEFRPKDIGEFNFEIQIENSNDASNIIQSQVHATVRSVKKDESLVVSSSALDFGDCFTGLAYMQRVILRNVSELPLDLTFVSESTAVVFKLKGDEKPDKFDGNANEVSSKKKRSIAASENIEYVEMPRFSDLLTQESIPTSEMSYPPSSMNSRSSSPTSYFRKDSELHGFSENFQDADDSLIRDSSGSFPGRDFVKHRLPSIGFSDLSIIEEMPLRPGTERSIIVCYVPDKELLPSDNKVGKLSRRNFRFHLEYSLQGSVDKERKTISCKARVCTSLIEVQPKEVNFGDTDVGTLKSAPLKIVNLSELPAKIELRFISKVLNSLKGVIDIPAKQSTEVKIDIYPRKVNPEYCKQITVVNLLNRDNDQIVEVKSNHIDKSRVTFHSLFYRILTPSSANFIDFGPAVVNSPIVRSFSVNNISMKKVAIELASSMPDDLLIFKKADVVGDVSKARTSSKGFASRRKERIIESISDWKNHKRFPDMSSGAPSNNPFTSTPQSALTSSNLASNSFKLKMSLESASSSEDSSLSPEYLDLASSKNLQNDARKSPKRKPGSIDAEKSRNREKFDLIERPSLARGLEISSGEKDIVKTKNQAISSVLNGEQSLRLFDFPDDDLYKGSLDELDPKNSDTLSGSESSAPLETLLTLLEQGLGVSPPLFTKASAEEKYVKGQLHLRRELDNAILDGRLQPANYFEIMPQQSIQVVLVMRVNSENRPNIQSKPRKIDAKIFIRLAEFDRSIRQPQFEQLLQSNLSLIPVRELMIRCSLCRSIMELGQKYINFGSLDKNEPRTKTIVIRNKSEAPLLYAIRKTGSIASGDLFIGEGRSGVIRGHGKKEVEFVFDPSLAGLFHERVTIENIQDRKNDQVLSVKANIRNPTKFHIETSSIDFGEVPVGRQSRPQIITISNISNKQARTLEIQADKDSLHSGNISIQIDLETVDDSVDPDVYGSPTFLTIDSIDTVSNRSRKRRPTVLLSADAEEKIESMEQKLKIAERKQKPEKVKKIREQLEKLKSGSNDEYGIRPQEASTGSGGEGLSKPFLITVETDPAKSSEGPMFSDLLLTQVKSGLAEDVDTLPLAIATRGKRKDSLVLTLEPRVIKTIAVYVTLSSKNEFSPYESGLLIMGKILVSELKNIDTTREISFRVQTPLEDREVAPKAWESRSVTAAPKSEDFSVTKLLRSYIPDLHMQKIAKELPPTSLVVASPSTLPSEDTPTFRIERTSIDLGRVDRGEWKDCYFTAVNLSEEVVSLAIDKPESELVEVDSCHVDLQPNETRRVFLKLRPIVTGQQSHDVLVYDSRRALSRFTVSFAFYCVLSSYFSFNFENSPISELDFGPCYINIQKRYAKVEPLEVENITEEPVVFSAISNLAQQCLIFADKALDKPANDILMTPKSSIMLYVALQPYFNSATPNHVASKNPNSLPSAPFNGDIRSLVGGIRFMAYESKITEKVPAEHVEPSFLLCTQVLKFTATFGVSQFSLSRNFFDFGIVYQCPYQFASTFDIVNDTPRLPLEYTLKHSEGILLSRSSGVVDGKSDDLSDTGKHAISFQLDLKNWGYYYNQILVRNENNPSERLNVDVNVFADIGWLKVYGLNLAASKEASSGGVQDDITYGLTSLPEIYWTEVYVSYPPAVNASFSESFSANAGVTDVKGRLFLQKRGGSELLPMYEKSFEIENVSEELLEIVPKTNLDIAVRWVVASGSGFLLEKTTHDESEVNSSTTASLTELSKCGQILYLHPKQKAQAYVTVPQAPIADESFVFQNGNRVESSGILTLDNLEHGVAIQAIKLRANYVLSVGELDPPLIDLGKVGYLSNWSDIDFTFSVRNQSDAALHYNFELPDFIEIISIDNDTNVTVERQVVEPRAVQYVKAALKCRHLESSSDTVLNFKILMNNLYNPQNLMALSVTGSVTFCEYRIDRLNKGELLLPALFSPPLESNPPCETWFSIANNGETDLRFEFEAVLTAYLASFIRVEVLSRFSNSPLNGVISITPHGMLEIRVIIFPVENSRLPCDPTLLDPDGILLGVLAISSFSSGPNVKEDRSVVENIPIRARIQEATILKISKTRIEFCALHSSDSDDDGQDMDDIKDEEATSRLSKQTETIVLSNISSTPVRFRTIISYPLELQKGLSIVNIHSLARETGTLGPYEEIDLEIDLADHQLSGLSEDIKVQFMDIDSITKHSCTLLIGLVERPHLSRSIISTDRQMKDDGNVSNSGMDDYMGSNPSLTILPKVSPLILQSSLAGISANIVSDPFSYEQSSATVNSENLRSAGMGPLSSDFNSSRHGFNPQLHVRGCKKFYHFRNSSVEIFGFYELDIGQQDISAGSITKKIVLENMSGDRISYRIRLLSESDKSWIQFSRLDGTLEPLRSSISPQHVGPNGRDGHNILLTFGTNQRGSFATYIFIENVDNAADTRVIKVSMEVVAKQNLRRLTPSLPNASATEHGTATVFDVFASCLQSGTDKSSECLDMGLLFFGNEYTAWSILIRNNESVPLDFNIKSTLPEDPLCELNFSLSRTSAKMLRSVTVPAESSVRIYLRLRLFRSSDPNLETFENLTAEVCVNCRLVKDFQKIIQLKAECWEPRIEILSKDFLFRGSFRTKPGLKEGETDVLAEVDPPSIELPVINAFNKDLVVEIFNDTQFFSIDDPNSRGRPSEPSFSIGSSRSFLIPAATARSLHVSVNIDAFLKSEEVLRREKYVSEHIMVYNRSRPAEKCLVNFRISFGSLQDFQFASGPRRATQILETRSFLLFRDMSTAPLQHLVPGQAEMPDILLLYIHIVSELQYYATHEQGSEQYLRLAHLLFSGILNLPIFRELSPFAISNLRKNLPPSLAPWTLEFLNFLTFFPHANQNLEPLIQLARSLFSDIPQTPLSY
ncbi:hypothetical protein HDU67_001804 [Dinochytrium kinnereticum]|nr:hypothetical protein HDU67_001804 [Dinochytrium kinnereticum]